MKKNIVLAKKTLDLRSNKDFALKLDQVDPLRTFQNEFYQLKDTIYLNGNSLGLCSSRAETSLIKVKEEWKTLGIHGWLKGNPPWFWFAEQLAENFAPLMGAYQDEITVSGSTTSNIHNLIATFYSPGNNREHLERKTKILMEASAFPTDIYAVKSQMKLKGYDPEEHLWFVYPDENGIYQEQEICHIIEQYDHDLALIFLSSVMFTTGQKVDLASLTRAAHDNTIPIGFDLSHSAGIMPHQLHQWGVDFATWCNYKWISAGPGATAALFVHRKHHPAKPAFTGWWGHDKNTQFEMNPDFTPAEGAGTFQQGTIDMLSAAPLEGALILLNEARIEAIREKSLAMTGYLIYLLDQFLEDEKLKIITPINDGSRGGHVAISHPEGFRINQAMKKNGIIADFRSPETIRLAPSPLYNSFSEVFQTVKTIREIIEHKTFLNISSKKDPIT